MTEERLVELALFARTYAYSPYSRFRVGAALECADGTVYTGCNVENAAYGETICAERTALVKAVSEGKREFLRIAVAGDGERPCWPCGACRQMLSEFAPQLTVLACDETGRFEKSTVSQLLPHTFSRFEPAEN